MTTVEIVFPYRRQPSEATGRALNTIREVYGVRRILFDEAAKQVRVEYDATRLNANAIKLLLCRTGLELGEMVPLTVPAPPPPPPAPKP